MPDVLRALSISGGLLFLVVVLIVIISIVTVKRGEAEVAAEHGGTEHLHVAAATASGGAAVAVKAAKPGVVVGDEISVINILLIGLGLFVVTVLLLLGVSLVEHLG